MKIVEHYPVIVVGATVRGCAAASVMPESLILESGVHLGGNWGLCYDRGRNWKNTLPESPMAEEFASNLFSRKAVLDDKVFNPALPIILADMALRHKWNVKLNLGFLEISQNRVVTRDVSGVTEFRAQRVIDARPSYRTEKRLTAVFHGTPGIPRLSGDDYAISPGYWPDQYDLSMRIPVSASWSEAREKVYHLMADLRERGIPLKLAVIGTCFAEMCFVNAVEEFNYGVSLGVQR